MDEDHLKKKLREVTGIINSNNKLQTVIDTHMKFKQCVMEKIVKRRLEYVPPNLKEAIDRIKDYNENEAEKKKLRAKMTIKDMFAKASDQLSTDNNNKIQKFATEMLKTQVNNKVRTSNLVKKFNDYYKNVEKELNITGEGGSEELSIRSKRSKISKYSTKRSQYK